MNYKSNNQITNIRRLSAQDLIDVVSNTKHPRFSLSKSKDAGYCFACGNSEGFRFLNILNDSLTAEWGVNKRERKSIDARESMRCNHCSNSMRSNFHAKAIVDVLAPSNSKNLKSAIKSKRMKGLRIAEVNACGALNQFLLDLPQLIYSEYKPKDSSVKHEDLENLSYKSSSIDAVLTSETLEHLPDWRLALHEIHRVLKPGGVHIFTVPALLHRKTRTRSKVVKGKEMHLLPPSFHGCTRGVNSSDYIVRNEFGADFRREVDEQGFDTKLFYRNFLRLSDPNFVFVSTKV